jgi:hypothetical protein
MEYLDPKKQKRYKLFLWFGYVLIGIAISIGCVILLWQSYGYNYSNGQVIQDGMIFLSSQPNSASIYINGQLNSASTNTRLTMPEGIYNFTLSSPGYRSWNHVVSIIGGQVIHYDYPLLFPVHLTSTTIAKYVAAPAIATQSPNQQYLVVSSSTNFNSFMMYDLTNPTVAPVTLTLPSSLVTAAQGVQSWRVVGWANDNQHLLLEHLYNGTQEFIELDTQNPAQSININKTFKVSPTSVTLNNLRYNQFYFYDATTQTLTLATIGSPTVTTVEPAVLDYKSYRSNILVYATTVGAPKGQVAIELSSGGRDYFVRDMPLSQTYLLNMASYGGNDYLVVGASSDSLVYLYENPLAQTAISSSAKIDPFRAIRIASPNYDSFAPTARFILLENGASFAVYDFHNQAMHYYTVTHPLDAPQTHAVWMDGDRLTYVSGGKLTVADYDNTNRQTLTSSLANYHPFFAPDYHSYFSFSQGKKGQIDLNQTSLVVS